MTKGRGVPGSCLYGVKSSRTCRLSSSCSRFRSSRIKLQKALGEVISGGLKTSFSFCYGEKYGENAFFGYKKSPETLLFQGFFVGSGRRIRTLTYGVRVRCATFTQSR